MKKVVLALFCSLLLVGCGNKKAEYKNITAKEVVEEIEKDDYFILDVRSSFEFRNGHLEDAINVDVEELNENILDLIPNKERKILVYCQSGNRSKIASERLISYGYTNVYNMMGGIAAYQEVSK